MQIRPSFTQFFQGLKTYTNSFQFEEDLNEILKELNPEGFKARFDDRLLNELSAKKAFFLSELKRRIIRGAGNGVLLSVETARSLQQFGAYILFTIGTEVLMVVIVSGKVILRRLFLNERGAYELAPEDSSKR